MFESKLDAMVREKVEWIVNAMLDAEADEIANAARYERTGERKAYRAGHYERKLTVKAGRLALKVPKLKGAVFESAVIERYRRREQSVEESLIDMYLGGCLHQTGRRHQPIAVGRPHALADIERQTQVVPEKLRTLNHGRPWRDDQFASTRLSSSRDMSKVAAGRPFVRGDVPDARAYKHQRAVPIWEAADHARAPPDLPVQPFDHVVRADAPAVPRGIFGQQVGRRLPDAPP